MTRIATASILLLLALAAPGFADAVRDVLAHANSDRLWVAHVAVQPTEQGPQDQTEIIFRQTGPNQRWRPLITIPARATALASRGSQLAVLLSSGQWMLVWSGQGTATGTPLPAHGRIRAIADDGQELWAIADIQGGLTAATQAAATQSAQPTPIVDGRVLPTKLVLFHEIAGRWVPIDQLPDDLIVPTSAQISVAILDGQPIVAAELGSGLVRVVRLSDRRWDDVTTITPPHDRRLGDFDLLNVSGQPLLWLSDGKHAGWIYLPAVAEKPLALTPVGNADFDSPPAIATNGSSLFLIGVCRGELYQQEFHPDGSAVGPAAAVSMAQLPQSELELWMDGTMVAALAFSVVATIYRRVEQKRRGTPSTRPPPAPAPIVPRLAAGLVDLLPVLITLMVLWFRLDLMQDPTEQLQRPGPVLALCLASAAYLLHTTLCELIWARTIGKWIFGLRTVTLDGQQPRGSQLLIRNLLRVIDLTWFPLGLVLITPLRQRSADIAAGTMVIRNEDSAAADA